MPPRVLPKQPEAKRTPFGRAKAEPNTAPPPPAPAPAPKPAGKPVGKPATPAAPAASKAAPGIPATPLDPQPKQQKRTKAEIEQGFRERGMAVVLARLASQQGVGVAELCDGLRTETLTNEGLPEKPSGALQREAHEIQRAFVNASIWGPSRAWRPGDLDLMEKFVDPKAIKIALQFQASGARLAEGTVIPAPGPAHAAAPPPTANGTAAPAAPKPRQPGPPRTISAGLWGYSATAIVRWLASNKVPLDRVRVVLRAKGIDTISDSTLKIQYNAGASGSTDRGELPALDAKQGAELLALVK